MLKDEMIELDFDRAEADLLGQLEAIDTLVATIGALPPPACVAVYGAWGSGKTTVMHNAMRRCRDRLWLPVWFRPWEYDRQPDLLQPLLRALLITVRSLGGRDPERWTTLKKRATRAAKAVAALGLRVGVRALSNGLLSLPADGGEGATQMAPADTAKLSIEELLERPELPADEVEDVKRRFKDLVDAALAIAARDGEPPADARVVFFLDDLDRCLPDQVVELIEGVKLLLCGETDCKAMFVFALDRQIVGEAIRQRFPGSTQYTGENYLEKIFDFSLEAPPVPLGGDDTVATGGTASLVRFVEQVAAGLNRDLESICKPLGGRSLLIEALSQPAFANPRVIKRTLNRLHLLTLTDARRQKLEAVDDRGRYRQYLLWVAGAERFRQFRHFMRVGTEHELRALLSMAQEESPIIGSVEIAQMRAVPAFRNYVRALKIVDSGLDRWHAYDAKAHQYELRWFDDLMRTAGV